MSQLVFIPGLLCTEALFPSQFQAFNGVAECRVADTLEMDSIDEMAEKCLQDITGPFAVLGFSMGGYVALEIARRAPERLTGLALVSTSAQPDTEEKCKQRAGLVELSQIGKFKGVTPRLLPRFFSPKALQDDAKTQIAINMGEKVGKDNFIRQQQAIMGRRDQRPYLPSFTKPSVVICGQLDMLTPPAHAIEMDSLLPHSRLHLLEDVGHMSTIEAPEAVNQHLLDWYQQI